MKEAIRFIIHNERIVMLINGKISADFPPEVAKSLSIALNQQALIIENEQRQRQNLTDQAILMRAGIPIGLGSNKKMLEEAHNEAQWNRELRRYMKNAPGIKSREIFGTPTIETTP
jgi:hypothetical protein